MSTSQAKPTEATGASVLAQLGVALAATAAALGLAELLARADPAAALLCFLAAVFASSYYARRLAGIFAAVLGGAGLWYCLTSAAATAPATTQNLLWSIGLFLAAALGAVLAGSSLRLTRAEVEQAVASRTRELNDGSRDAAEALTRLKSVESALRKSEAVARGMFETAVDAIITIDAAGTVGSFNLAAERLFGYTASEVVGQNVRMLMPEPYRGEHDGYLRRYITTGHARIIGIGREVVGRKKNGDLFPMDLAVGKQQDGDHLLFTGTIRDLTERKRLEREIIEISGREQQRIAQDLHDGLGQHLTGIAFFAKAMATRLHDRHLPEAEQCDHLTELLNRAIAQTRGLARGLFPVSTSESVADALDDLAAAARKLFSIDCVSEAGPSLPEIDATTSSHLYRIVQEAIHNAVRHASAKRIHITLTSDDRTLVLTVTNDGPAFVEGANRGIGLRIMRYRASIIGAQLEIGPGRSGGAVLRCLLPLPAPPPAELGALPQEPLEDAAPAAPEVQAAPAAVAAKPQDQ